MEHDKEVTMLLLVDPESNCRLINLDDGKVYWLVEDNTPLVYEYQQQTTLKDFLKIVGGKYGDMDLYRHRSHTKPQLIWCKEEKDIEAFLNQEYGENLELEANSKDMYINFETGAIDEESPRNFLIVKKDFKIKFFSTQNLKTIVQWQLDFTRFEAFFPCGLNEKLKRAPCHVFHAINEDDFYKFCKKSELKEPDGVGILEHLKWKRPQTKEIRITTLVPDKLVGETNMLCGEFDGIQVAVEILEKKGILSKHVRNLRNLGVHKNILRFLQAETNGIYDKFAFDNRFTISLAEYLLDSADRLVADKEDTKIKILRGIINGLQFLHIHKVRHGKLNTQNVIITDNCVSKLAGLAYIDWPPAGESGSMDEYLSVDIYDLGKILLHMMTSRRYDSDNTWNDDDVAMYLQELPVEAEEVRHLLSMILQKDYKLRPALEKILQHAAFCDFEKRLALMVELTDFLEHKRNNHVATILNDIVGPKLFGTSWKSYFTTDVLDEVQSHRKEKYDFEKLTYLLRFYFDIMSHHSEIKSEFGTSLGETKAQTELIFRQKFPKLFIYVFEVVKVHLAKKFKSYLPSIDPDFKFEPSQTLTNPYI